MSRTPSTPARPSLVEEATRARGSEHRVELLELGDAERRGDVGEPVVEAEPVVVEPAHVDGPALVALAAQAGRLGGVGGDDHPPLPRRHLLVGVEGEGGEVAAGADLASLGVDRAERLTGVLEEAEAVLGGKRLELRHRRRVAEDVDRQDADRALADRRRRGSRIEVERLGVDVAEDRPGALVEQAVGRGDEAEGAGQDLVTRRPSRAPARRGAAPVVPLETATASSTPSQAANSRSKRSPIGPSESRPGAQHLEHELLLAGADLGLGERDRLDVRTAHARRPYPASPSSPRGWKA